MFNINNNFTIVAILFIQTDVITTLEAIACLAFFDHRTKLAFVMTLTIGAITHLITKLAIIKVVKIDRIFG
jgi:hypothetical protein